MVMSFFFSQHSHVLLVATSTYEIRLIYCPTNMVIRWLLPKYCLLTGLTCSDKNASATVEVHLGTNGKRCGKTNNGYLLSSSGY